jgi:hydrogenase maturation protease
VGRLAVSERVLVAGIGNIFFGDDGFGSEVVRQLSSEPIEGARVEDFGIRGLHLAYEMLAGYEHAVFVDAVTRGGAPGTLYVIEPDSHATGEAPDAHRMDIANVFAFVRTLGGEAPPVTLIGCEPETLDEGIGLSRVVAAAVGVALPLVRRIAAAPVPVRNPSSAAS